MKLKSFRIYHYKSIVDSGDCPLAADFTTLIGKNESGKTAILEALRDFDNYVPGVSHDAFPVSGVSVTPQIELTFEIFAKELDDIIHESGKTIDLSTRREILAQGIRVTKNASGEFQLSKGTIKQPVAFAVTQSHLFGPPIDDEINKLSKLIGIMPTIPPVHDEEGIERAITALRRRVLRQLNLMEESNKKEAVETLHGLTRLLKNYQPPQKPVAEPQVAANQSSLLIFDSIKAAVLKRLPRFIYFSDFKDVLPFEATLEDLKTNQSLKDLAFLAGQDLSAIAEVDDIQKRMNLLNNYSAKISGNFLEQWQQDTIEIVVRPEGDKFIFGIKEKEGTDLYKMNQRSKGFQWFLSFYLKINRFVGEEVVLLIDEPGTNLHPVAQKDILNIIKSISTDSKQVIFTTHSASLIEANRLDRVRCVVKKLNLGTAVISQVTTEVDEETLLPVRGALASGLPVRIPTSSWLALEETTTTVSEEEPSTTDSETETDHEESNVFTRAEAKARFNSEETEQHEETEEASEEGSNEEATVENETTEQTPPENPDEESAANILKRAFEKKIAAQEEAVQAAASEAFEPVEEVAVSVADEAEERIKKAIVREKEKDKIKLKKSHRPLFGWLRK